MLYIVNMIEDIVKEQSIILNVLEGKLDDFYLAGGTALSLIYLSHRQSDDLDFFTQEFYVERVREIVELLRKSTNKNITLVSENLSKLNAEIMVYNVEVSKEIFLKIDFVRDVLPLLKPVKLHKGVNVLSMEDIYLRKIFTVSGLPIKEDEIGRKRFMGGRQEAKDLFDIYFLSKEFSGLSDFIDKYCDQVLKEGVIRWFRTFKRMEMKADLADIKTEKTITFRDIDRHLDEEIKKILEKEIDLS